MGTTITLKGIPNHLYERLKLAAKAHHRSLNSEVIACLERQLSPTVVSADERLARARAIRARLGSVELQVKDISTAVRSGRA
ncbi:MAG: Arc family DNA-binding protein [Pseudomonadales bacterium]